MATTIAFDLIAHDRASAKFDHLGRSVDNAGSKFGKLKTMAKAGALAIAAAGVAAGKVAFDAVQAAGDLGETISKTNQIFGGPNGQMLAKWAEDTATQIGMSQRVTLDAAATFGIMGKAAGKSGGDLRVFAQQNTMLAADLASFNNSTPEEAIEALGAAFRGEAEPIRKFGVLLDDATLRNQALKMGLIETTTQALTPQQKVLASHAVIMKQTSDAQGDFERTSGGLANQQRILKAQLENVQAELGQKLLPIAVKFATFLNDEGIPALQRFGSWAKDHVAPVVRELGQWVETKLIPPLKKLADDVMAGASKAFSILSGSGDDFRNVLKYLGDILTNVVIPTIGWLSKNVLPILAAQLKISIAILSKIADGARAMARAFKESLGPILAVINPIIDKLQEAFGWMQRLQGNTVITGGLAKGGLKGTPWEGQRGDGGSGGSEAPNPAPTASPRPTRTTSRTTTGGDEETLYKAFKRALSEQPIVRLPDTGRELYAQGGF